MLALQRLDSRMAQPQQPLPDEDPGLMFGWHIDVNVDEIFGFDREPLPQLTPPDNPPGPPILDTGETSTLDAFFDHMQNNTMPPLNYGEGLTQLNENWFSGDLGPPPLLVGTSTTLGLQTDPTLSSPANLEMPQMTFPTAATMVNGASQPGSFTPVAQTQNQNQHRHHHHHRNHHHHHHHHHHHQQPHLTPPMPSPAQQPVHQPHSEQEIAAATALQNTALFQNRNGRPDYTSFSGNPAAGGVFEQSQQTRLAAQSNQQPVFSTNDSAVQQPFGFTITPNQHAPHTHEQSQVPANVFQPRVYMNGNAHVQPQPQHQTAPTAPTDPEPAIYDHLRNPQWGSDPSFNKPHGYVPQTTQEDSTLLEQERLKYVGCLEPVAPSSNDTTGSTTPISPAGKQTRLDRLLSEYDNTNAANAMKFESEDGAELRRASIEGENDDDDDLQPFSAKGKARVKPSSRPRLPKRLKITSATSRKSPSSELTADSQAPEASPELGDGDDCTDAAGKPLSGKRRKSSTAPQKPPRVNLTSEQKRLNHINSEKRRRGNIKDQLQDLQSEIDPIKDQKMSKGVVAEKTFEFIEALLHDNQYLLDLGLQHGWSEESLAGIGDGQNPQHNGANQQSRPSTDAGYANSQSALSTSEQAFGMNSMQNGHNDHHAHSGAHAIQQQQRQQNGLPQSTIGLSAVRLNGVDTQAVSVVGSDANDLSVQQSSGYDSYTAAPQDGDAGASGNVQHQQIFQSPTMFGTWNGGGQLPTSPHSLFG